MTRCLSCRPLSSLLCLTAGFRSKQIVRASPSFRNNKRCDDGVMYAVESDVSIERADGATVESRNARQEMHRRGSSARLVRG